MSVVAPDNGLLYVGGSARVCPLSAKPSGSTVLNGNMFGHRSRRASVMILLLRMNTPVGVLLREAGDGGRDREEQHGARFA
jgi:hypothetical protein